MRWGVRVPRALSFGTGLWGVINRLSVCLLTHCNLLLWGNRVINSQHRRFVLALARPSCEASWRTRRGQVTYDAGQDQWPFITIHIADKFLHKLASYARLLKVLSAPFVWRLFIETFPLSDAWSYNWFLTPPTMQFYKYSACPASDFGHCVSNKDLYKRLSWNCIFKTVISAEKYNLIHSASLKFTWPNHVRATVWNHHNHSPPP